MSKVKVSILVPIYNSEKSAVFQKCLESLASQSYVDYEIILIDNGSTDNTMNIIQNFKKKNDDRQIVILSETKKGRGAARRKGELHSSGEIILMTDSDCIVPENWISLMIRPILENIADAVQGLEINNNKNFWSDHIQEKLREKYKSNFNCPVGHIDTKNFAIRRSVLTKIGFSPAKYPSSNDTALSIQLYKTRARIHFNRASIVKHQNESNFRKFIKKKFYRAFWIRIVTMDNKECLIQTSFLKDTNQTYLSFIIFFPGLLITLISKGWKLFYFDCIEGLAWRMGLLCGTVYRRFIFRIKN